MTTRSETSTRINFSVTAKAQGICCRFSSIKSGNGGNFFGSGKRSSTMVTMKEQKNIVAKASRKARKVFFLSERISKIEKQRIEFSSSICSKRIVVEQFSLQFSMNLLAEQLCSMLVKRWISSGFEFLIEFSTLKRNKKTVDNQSKTERQR